MKKCRKTRNGFIEDRYNKIEGSNAYARLRAIEVDPFTDDHGTLDYRLQLNVQKSTYVAGALRELSTFPRGTSKTFDDFFADKNISNFGVEILLVGASTGGDQLANSMRPDAGRRIALQRRSERPFSYKHAWDVSASGFIDCREHKNVEGSLSLVTAASKELREEIAIPAFSLPNHEHFEFFGIVHLPETGHTDVVGQCLIDLAKFESWYREGNANIRSVYVEEVRAIDLTSRAVLDFLDDHESHRYWNPTGFLTLIAALRRAGFEPADIWVEMERAIPRMQFQPHKR